MPDVNSTLLLMAWAGTIAVVAFCLIAQPWREQSRGMIRLAWALAVGCGFTAGYVYYFGWPTWPVTQSHQWLVVAIAPVVVAIDIVALWGNRTRFVALALSLLLLYGYGTLILLNLINRWPASRIALTLAIIGTISLLMVALLGGLAHRRIGRTLALGLALCAAATAIVIFHSGSITIGMQAVALTSALIGGWIVTWWVPSAVAAAGVSGAAAILLLAILVQGIYLAKLTMFNGILLALAPLVLWIGELPVLAQRSSWVRTSIRLTVLVAILAIPTVLARLQFLKDLAT